MASNHSAPPPQMSSPFQTLPDDLLQRVLVGVPLDDHHAAAAVCQAFHSVITGSRFPALRQKYGFAERGVVKVRIEPATDVLSILMAHNESDVLATIPLGGLSSYSTTDGGTRLFLSNNIVTGISDPPNEVVTVDVSSRRWRRLALLPQSQHEHCIEWHGGLLYVAGGTSQNRSGHLNSFHAFNETTGLWEDLPPMPQATRWAASSIIGNQLFIAGGDNLTHNGLPTLQIYDIASRTWRMGASLPDSRSRYAMGYVVDGKLCLMNEFEGPILFYDPQSNTWTEEPALSFRYRLACVHDGRLIVYQENGTVLARATDGSWFPYADAEPGTRTGYRFVSESVLLG